MRGVVARWLTPIEMRDPPSLPDVAQRYVVARGSRVCTSPRPGTGHRLFSNTAGRNTGTWHPIIPDLAEHFRLICPDMRGFGLTDARADGYGKDGFAEGLLAVCDALRAPAW